MQIRAIQSILEKIVPGVFEKILRKILARVVTLSSLCPLPLPPRRRRLWMIPNGESVLYCFLMPNQHWLGT